MESKNNRISQENSFLRNQATLSPTSSTIFILHKNSVTTNNSDPKVPNCKPLFWCYMVSVLPVLPQFQINPFRNQILIISFKLNPFRSNTQIQWDQTHLKKKNSNNPVQQSWDRIRSERERNQRKKAIRVGHGRPNSTRLSRELAEKPLLMAVTVSASGS